MLLLLQLLLLLRRRRREPQRAVGQQVEQRDAAVREAGREPRAVRRALQRRDRPQVRARTRALEGRPLGLRRALVVRFEQRCGQAGGERVARAWRAIRVGEHEHRRVRSAHEQKLAGRVVTQSGRRLLLGRVKPIDSYCMCRDVTHLLLEKRFYGNIFLNTVRTYSYILVAFVKVLNVQVCC